MMWYWQGDGTINRFSLVKAYGRTFVQIVQPYIKGGLKRSRELVYGMSCCATPILAEWNRKLEPVYRYVAKRLILLLYNIDGAGFEKIPEQGGVLLISNHVSYMDGLIINALCKRRVRYIIDYSIYNAPIIRYFMQLNRAIPISAKKEHIVQALDAISEGLKAGDVICIFPEGHLTYTGFMSHFRPGVEWIIRRDPTPIYPIIINGLWGSIFSRKYYGSLRRFFPKILRRRVTVLCGDVIQPEEVTIDQLHLVMLDLRRKLAR